jgi:hypothetical protein
MTVESAIAVVRDVAIIIACVVFVLSPPTPCRLVPGRDALNAPLRLITPRR